MRIHTRAAVATTAALALLTLAGCSADPEPTATDPQSTAESSSTPTEEPSEPATTDASPSAEPSGSPDLVTVPVYFVGDTPQGPRLFREFRRVESDNPLEEAAALLTAGDTLDPDYRTLFPGGGEIASISHDAGGGGQIIVQVVDDGWADRPSGMSRAEARIAVQSLVHTLQGVAQERAALRVVSQRGSSVSLFGIPTDDGVTNAPPLDVLALVSVTSPEEGSTVSGSFTASGVASSFEATVPWEIRRDGEVVDGGFSTAEGWMDKLYPWETEVDVSGLEPGAYEFVALTDDPSGGAEGAGPTEDSKSLTVE